MEKIVPFLWFADNNAMEAITYYCGVFPGSTVNHVEYYPDEKLDEHFIGMAGKVLTADFTLNGRRFMALDGGPHFRFNEAISLLVACENQEEIDFYWDRLSHSKEHEQCGWCRDRFGLSWQIVPRDLGRLLRSEASVRAMMAMKKIVISELIEAGRTAD